MEAGPQEGDYQVRVSLNNPSTVLNVYSIFSNKKDTDLKLWEATKGLNHVK